VSTKPHRCDVKGCSFSAQTPQGLGAHRHRAHGIPGKKNGGPKSRTTSARKIIERDLQWIETVQKMYPKGIQTDDPVRLQQDLGVIFHIREVMHSA
jgi:hypothetical protein